MTKEKLTIEEVKKEAIRNYLNGGDCIIECWSDEEIKEWIEYEGTLEELKRVFKINVELYYG